MDSLLSANVGCLIAFVLLGGVPLVALGGFFVYQGRSAMHEQARLNESAVSVDAVILSSEVKRTVTRTGAGSAGTSAAYWPVIHFSYEYGGVVRTSNKVWPVGEGGREAEAQAIVRAYPEGGQVSAFVDPDEPDSAFLEKHWSLMPYLSVLFGVLPLAWGGGLGILLTGWRRPHLAFSIAALIAALVVVVIGIAGEDYLRVLPDAKRSGWMSLAFMLSLLSGLLPLAAMPKARRLHRLHLEGLKGRARAAG